MRVGHIDLNGKIRTVCVRGAEAIDLAETVGSRISAIALLSLGKSAIDGACDRASSEYRYPLESLIPLSPVFRSDKIIGIGMNYHSFVAAARIAGMPVPTERLWFQRPSSCIAGPCADIWLPRDADDMDYEGELAIVIGRRCRLVSRADAYLYVAGFTVANDLTLRQRARTAMVLGKSFEGHTPLGPWLVTPDEIDYAQDLKLSTWLNGVLCQQASTADMIANCSELVSELSDACVLNPGDIILTGTPSGCGLFKSPPVSLKEGDIIKVEIEGIGAIVNRIIREPIE